MRLLLPRQTCAAAYALFHGVRITSNIVNQCYANHKNLHNSKKIQTKTQTHKIRIQIDPTETPAVELPPHSESMRSLTIMLVTNPWRNAREIAPFTNYLKYLFKETVTC